MTGPNPRSSRRSPEVTRQPVAGECRNCRASELRRYAVNSEGGWFIVLKCQRCLTSHSRERGPRLGPIKLLSDSIDRKE